MKIIIIGAGQAGLQSIISLRQGGFAGDITLIGDESVLPYQRPPLSKDYLSGKLARERLFLKPENFFAENNIKLQLATRAEKIDAKCHSLQLANGRTLTYDKLVLATGSRPRLLDIAGREFNNIFDLRSMADIDAMQPLFKKGKNLAIIGGGYIGLEVAAVARQLGLAVTLLEAAPRLLARVAEPEISTFYRQLHKARGVNIMTDAQVVGFANNEKRGDKNVAAVCFANGETLATDMVIIGIGIVPNVELAQAAGLEIGNGILVDAACRTSHADIFACGDCAFQHNAVLDYGVRLESVPNAIEQGKQVAAAILEAPPPRAETPWFWSNQYDIKLQIAGLPIRIDEKVQRGSNKESGSSKESGSDNENSFAWFYFTDNKLTGCTAINRPAEFMATRQLMQRGQTISPQQVADPNTTPKSWLAM